MSIVPEIALAGLALAISVIAAAHDARDHRIPNWLTYPALGASVILQILFGDPLAAALGGCTAFAIGFLLFALRAFGGGDVKLLCVLGVLLGQTRLIEICVVSTLLGAVLGVLILLKNGKLLGVIREFAWFIGSLAQPGLRVKPPVVDEVVPFAVVIAASVSLVLIGFAP